MPNSFFSSEAMRSSLVAVCHHNLEPMMPNASTLPPHSLLVVLALPAYDHIPLRRAATLLTYQPLLNQQLQVVLRGAHGNILASQ